MIDLREVRGDIAEIVAIALDRQEHGWAVEHETVADFKEAERRPLQRYMNDRMFNAKVEATVAQIMHAFNRAADLNSESQ